MLLIKLLQLGLLYFIPVVAFATSAKTIIPILSLLLGETPAIYQCEVGFLADINGPATSVSRSNPQFANLGNQTFFIAKHSDYGDELWVTDGTSQGTHLVEDIDPGTGDGMFGAGALTDRMIKRAGDTMYFLADDDEHGEELWVTDGSAVGTFMLKDVDVGSLSSHIGNLTEYQNKLYFLASSVVVGGEGLWVSDGTTGGTELIKELFVSANEHEMAVVNDKLLFAGQGIGSDSGTGNEIWVSDGSSGGTQLLKDIDPGGASSFPDNFAVLENQAFFIADDGSHGDELWVTDGTSANTRLVKDINPGTEDGVRELHINFNFKHNPGFNGKLYFPATTPEHGRELWGSDGSASGTQLAKDIKPGAFSSLGSDFEGAEVFNNRFYFQADTSEYGLELWQVDSNGFVSLAKDLDPGDSNSTPSDFASNEDYMFFSADREYLIGNEPTIMDTKGRIHQIDNESGTTVYGPEYIHIRNDGSAIFIQPDFRGVSLYQINCPAPNDDD